MPIEKSVTCPRNDKWLRAMLDLLPPGVRGKLAPFEECFSTPSSSVQPPSAGRQESRRRRVIHPKVR